MVFFGEAFQSRDVQAVFVAEPDIPWSISMGARKVGTVRGIVGARWDQFHAVGSKYRQFADVAFPLRKVPGVVRVGLGPIAQLMPSDCIRRPSAPNPPERRLVRASLAAHARIARRQRGPPGRHCLQ